MRDRDQAKVETYLVKTGRNPARTHRTLIIYLIANASVKSQRDESSGVDAIERRSSAWIELWNQRKSQGRETTGGRE